MRYFNHGCISAINRGNTYFQLYLMFLRFCFRVLVCKSFVLEAHVQLLMYHSAQVLFSIVSCHLLSLRFQVRL